MDHTTAPATSTAGAAYAAPAQTRIGHVHLQVTNLDKALRFYRDILGFQVMQRFGDQAAFLPAGGYHHIGLNTWNSRDELPARKHGAGLYHTAILMYHAGKVSRRPCGSWPRPATPSPARPTTGYRRPCTWTTPTATAWSSIGTGPARSNPRPPMAACRCTPAPWT